MNIFFSLTFQVLDDKNVRRRFRASNYQSTTRVKPFICTMPMRLDDGWNQIQFNLADFTRRAYGTNYVVSIQLIKHSQELYFVTSCLIFLSFCFSGNIASANSRQLSDPTSLLFRSFVLRGRVTGRVQIVFTRTAKATRGYEFNGSSPTERTSRHRRQQ